MGHDHAEHAHGNRRRLASALVIVVLVLMVELLGAWLSGSLALLADAGHMTSDAIGLVVALVASMIAARPATDRHTFGFRRVEVLGALVNGALLTVVAITVAVEAITRLITPHQAHVNGLPLLIVAAVGLAANLVGFAILRGGDRESLNMRGAHLEVLGDLIGSVAALVAGVVILTTGFGPADAIASLLIAVLIVPRAVSLLRDVVHVLTESVPRGLQLETPGVVDVHDVHVWAITSGDAVFTAHVEVAASVFESGEADEMLDRLGECLKGHFDVEHSTFQLEPAGHAAHEGESHR
jgi:cobalt-zinc-cadmium efflux system protein